MATEKRLIDANEAYEIARTSGLHDDFGRCMADLTSLKELLEDCPTVDAVEVVRCKKCAHCTVTSDGMVCERALPTKRMEDYYIYGSTVLARVAPDDFCSHGERRTYHV